MTVNSCVPVDLVLLAVILVVDVFVGVPGREITVMWMLTNVLLHLIFVVLIRRASTQMVAMSVTVDLGTRKRLPITVFLVQVRNYYLPFLNKRSIFSGIVIICRRCLPLLPVTLQYFSGMPDLEHLLGRIVP